VQEEPSVLRVTPYGRYLCLWFLLVFPGIFLFFLPVVTLMMLCFSPAIILAGAIQFVKALALSAVDGGRPAKRTRNISLSRFKEMSYAG
jgi:hypothetical protein